MTTVNPIQTNTTESATAFKSKKNYLKNLANKIACPYSGKVVSPQEATIEHLSGAAYAEAHTKAEKVMQEVIANMKIFPKMELTPEQAMMEKINGMVYAATGRSKEEIQARVMNEAMMGNKDFIAGVNEYLAKNAAKNGYKK